MLQTFLDGGDYCCLSVLLLLLPAPEADFYNKTLKINRA